MFQLDLPNEEGKADIIESISSQWEISIIKLALADSVFIRKPGCFIHFDQLFSKGYENEKLPIYIDYRNPRTTCS